MNHIAFEEQWKHRRDQVRTFWNLLSDNDVDRVGGRYAQLADLLHQKYGLTPDQIEAEIDQWLEEPLAEHARSGVPGA